MSNTLDTTHLEIRGASEHNLRNLNVTIPKNSLVVFSGVSGSGKSSLAFDTIYVEGQRKYIESLSSYARQFLGQLERPKYERMRGLAPTVAIEQKTASSNPRSTVGTVTEILDYMRVLYARAGDQRCPKCDAPVGKQDPQQIVDRLMALPEDNSVILHAPLVRQRKGEFKTTFEDLMKEGFVRFRIDGEIQRLERPLKLEKNKKHNIDIVVDRIRIRPGVRGRLTDSVETALKAGNGRLTAQTESEELQFSESLYCDQCDISLPELTPQLFSFNSPLGACPTCHGLGVAVEIDPDAVFRDAKETILKTVRRISVIWKGRRRGWNVEFWRGVEELLGLDPRRRIRTLSEEERDQLLYGYPMDAPRTKKSFLGLWGYVSKDLSLTSSEAVRAYYMRFLKEKNCRSCDGTRLRPEARSVYLGKRSITDLASRQVGELLEFYEGLQLDDHRQAIAEEPRKEIARRLRFLVDVGLQYLTLDRAAHSLSGGEAQRIRLARQLGSELSGVIYILDEPSIGLHQRDSLRLVKTLLRLKDLGNTIVVVEHDPETIRHADWVVDFGPGAGRLGGEVVCSGTLKDLHACTRSLTGDYLSGRKRIEVPPERRKPSGWITLEGVKQHNLDGLNVEIPLGNFTVVTGVSGAGKSTLVSDVLNPLLDRQVNDAKRTLSGGIEAHHGLKAIDKVITIDQKPIGRTPRSNPATYTKLFDGIRKLFAATKDARAYGYGPGRFSFNVKGGRCERCKGDGALKIEMHFLPDVYIQCPQCKGKRFNEATLRVQYKGLTISDVLDLTVEQALEVFKGVSSARRILQTMSDVGLDYLRLGQPSPTLSGGEAQRIKLARELAKSQRGHTFYILDEPTTGLHFHDIRKLISVIDRFADAGHSVLMVEHNLDLIKCADWVIDLGPEGGDGGGRLVAAGPPETIAACKESYTGRYLKEVLNSDM